MVTCSFLPYVEKKNYSCNENYNFFTSFCALPVNSREKKTYSCTVTCLHGSVYMTWVISLVGTLRRYLFGNVSMEILEILYHPSFFY